MTGEPLLLVDIDGVLSPYGAAALPDGFADYDLFPDDDEPVRLASAHGDWLRELGEVFEVVWAPSWGDRANELIGPILGVAFPHVPFPDEPFDPAEKVPAIDEYTAGRPAAWIDDQCGPEARLWADTRQDLTLLIEIEPTAGLTRATVERLLRWATEPDRSGWETA